MRRDRTGEIIEDDVEHACPLGCADGWLDDPAEADRPRPCPRCRPWTRRRRPVGSGSTAAARAAARRLWTSRTATHFPGSNRPEDTE